MRASRLVQLLLILQHHGRATAQRLAEELEVSVRTIYRDVEALGEAGVPIYTASGPGGGIQLVDGYQTRLTGLTAPEATALGLAGVPGAAAQLGLGSVLVAAQAKVDAALPPELRARASRLRERFLVDLPGWFGRVDEVPMLATVSRAVWDGRRLRIVYDRGGRTVDRTVDPLGLVLKGGAWYLVALVGRQGALRTYRLARVAAADELDEACSRPPDFDLALAWDDLGRSFDRDLRDVEVRARMPADALWRLRHAVPAVAADEAIAGATEVGDDGWCEIVVRSESVDVAHDELLRLGRHVEVVSPLALRAMLAATGAAIAAHHRGRADEPSTAGATGHRAREVRSLPSAP